MNTSPASSASSLQARAEHGAPITSDNIHFLRQGVTLLDGLEDRLYAAMPPIKMSPAGAHLRHCLDLYTCFFAGLEEGRVDYDARDRDPRLETDREYALGVLRSVIDRLEQTECEVENKPLLVAMDRGRGEHGAAAFCASSVKRELQFLRSHTVHHYALIAAVLRLNGHEPPPSFGVAPATLTYREEQAALSVGG